MENADKGNASSREGLLLRLGLNDNKAGMQGLDKEKINKIIIEASKGSKFYENELKKDQQVNERIEKILTLKSKVTDQQLMKAQRKMDKLAMKLDQNRDLSCTIVHIDMDAFYAAVELRDNPELRDKPIAVGSMSMLSTSNYHARRFGVRAAMPGFIAKKLCPHLTIVPLNFKKYEEVSKEVREILAEYDPHFMPMGLDEAYLNITEYLEERKNWPEDKRQHFIKTYNSALNEQQQQSTTQIKPVVFGTSAEEVVEEIRFRIEQKTGLTASAGIAPNTMLAKMCSDKNKPNGQYRIPPERDAVMNFIKDLAIRKVPGIGKVTEKMLKALNIVICSELYQQRALISLLFSETSWRNFLEISLGLGSTHLERDGERKSMSTERTFNEISPAEQFSLCQELCSDLAEDLRKEGLRARTVTLKLKNVNFEVKTRATTVTSAVSTEQEIFAVAKDLLRSEMEAVAPQPLRLRLMGVRVSGFLNEEEKKYQQKSIVNFLEPGKHISTTGLFPRKSEEEIFPNASEKESFFNKKRATRQQTNQAVSLNMSPNKQNIQDMKSSVMSVEPMENNGEHQIFICPVCFEEHQDCTLEAFNRHIDRCLNGTLEEDKTDNRKSWENTTELSINMEKNECQEDKTSKPQNEVQFADRVDNAANRSTDIFPKLEDGEHSRESECNLSSNFGFDTCAKQDFPYNVLSVGKEKYFEEPSSSEIKFPCFPDAPENKVLVCPVCNLEQKTMDLAVFNRHVDVCLNKGIIKQLTEESKSLGILDRGQGGTNFTAGTKRSATVVSQSTSKKAKSNNSKCTIESFFK